MKSALPWICAVAFLAAAIFFFNAGRQKEAELAQLRIENQEVGKLRAENEGLKKIPAMESEITKLKKDNEDLLRLRNEVRQLRSESTQLGTKLAAAEKTQAAQSQERQRLAQLAQENQTLRSQSEQLQAATAQVVGQQQAVACMNILRQIDGAKQQWALENNKTLKSVPTMQDLLPYFPQKTPPTCPAGGAYTLGTVEAVPTCTIQGHVMPTQ